MKELITKLDGRESHDRAKKPALVSALIGAIIGDVLWGLALLSSLAFQAIQPSGVLVAAIASICVIFAAPIPVGGYFLIWGDDGPPYRWIDSWAVNIAFGVCFYALVGATVGFLLAGKMKWTFGVRKMLIIVTIFAVILGIISAFDVLIDRIWH